MLLSGNFFLVFFNAIYRYGVFSRHIHAVTFYFWNQPALLSAVRKNNDLIALSSHLHHRSIDRHCANHPRRIEREITITCICGATSAYAENSAPWISLSMILDIRVFYSSRPSRRIRGNNNNEKKVARFISQIIRASGMEILTLCAGNWLADHNEWPNRIYNSASLSFPFELVGMTSLDRNYWGVINLLFVLSGLHLNISKTEETLQFSDEEFWTYMERHSSARVSQWIFCISPWRWAQIAFWFFIL